MIPICGSFSLSSFLRYFVFNPRTPKRPNANPPFDLHPPTCYNPGCNAAGRFYRGGVQGGTGEREGGVVEESIYEGYGPEGVAILVACATDNRNRTVADVRNIFNKCGGRLAESGSVAYLFGPPIGLITVSNTVTDEDTLIAVALDAGAEDVKAADDVFVIYTGPGDVGKAAESF